MSTLYRILRWDELYENHRSRRYNNKTWCPIPNKQDGLGYGRIMALKDGEAIYGAFVAVVLAASKQDRPRGGHLTDTGRSDGNPLDSEALCIKTRARARVIQRMLEVTSDPSIGWIGVSETKGRPEDTRGTPGGRGEDDGRKEGRKEGRTGEEERTMSDFTVWYGGYFRKEKRDEAETAWKKLTQEQKAKALQVVGLWCRWKAATDARKYWPMPGPWLNGKRFDDEVPPDPAELCTRCGKEPRRPDSEMGEKCFKETGADGQLMDTGR